MPQEELSGYIGLAHELLAKAGVRIGDRIRLELKRAAGEEVVEGLLMPRYRTESEENYVVVKLKTGYNVGVRVDSSTKITQLGKGQQPQFTASASALPEAWSSQGFDREHRRHNCEQS